MPFPSVVVTVTWPPDRVIVPVPPPSKDTVVGIDWMVSSEFGPSGSLSLASRLAVPEPLDASIVSPAATGALFDTVTDTVAVAVRPPGSAIVVVHDVVPDTASDGTAICSRAGVVVTQLGAPALPVMVRASSSLPSCPTGTSALAPRASVIDLFWLDGLWLTSMVIVPLACWSHSLRTPKPMVTFPFSPAGGV